MLERQKLKTTPTRDIRTEYAFSSWSSFSFCLSPSEIRSKAASETLSFLSSSQIHTLHLLLYMLYRVFFALSFCATSVGNTISYMQDYTKAKYAARRMLQLINRKSEIDPTVAWGMRPVSILDLTNWNWPIHQWLCPRASGNPWKHWIRQRTFYLPLSRRKQCIAGHELHVECGQKFSFGWRVGQRKEHRYCHTRTILQTSPRINCKFPGCYVEHFLTNRANVNTYSFR